MNAIILITSKSNWKKYWENIPISRENVKKLQYCCTTNDQEDSCKRLEGFKLSEIRIQIFKVQSAGSAEYTDCISAMR